MHAVFQQPLLQFLFLGTAVFSLERWIAGTEDDPRRIVIDDERYAEIAGIYKDNLGRAPSEAEMADLTIKWAQNEVLYREARLMSLDEGDEMIRQRLILKLRNVFFNRVNDGEISEKALEDWFIENRSRYDIAPKYVVEQFLFADGSPSEKTVSEASALRERLAVGDRVPERFSADMRAYGARSQQNLALLFDSGDVEKLVNAPLNSWQILSSSVGLHLARGGRATAG